MLDYQTEKSKVLQMFYSQLQHIKACGPRTFTICTLAIYLLLFSFQLKEDILSSTKEDEKFTEMGNIIGWEMLCRKSGLLFFLENPRLSAASSLVWFPDWHESEIWLGNLTGSSEVHVGPELGHPPPIAVMWHRTILKISFPNKLLDV